MDGMDQRETLSRGMRLTNPLGKPFATQDELGSVASGLPLGMGSGIRFSTGVPLGCSRPGRHDSLHGSWCTCRCRNGLDNMTHLAGTLAVT